MDFFSIKSFLRTDSLRKKAFLNIFILAVLTALLMFSGIFLTIGFRDTEIGKIIKKSTGGLIILAVFMLIFIVSGAFIVGNSIVNRIITSLKNYKSLENDEKISKDLKELFILFGEENEKMEEAYNKEINDLKQQIKRLEYDRKKEIDPESFNNFVEGINELTKTERKIFDLYREGYTVKEILKIAKIKESTLRYHNQNIYSKLSVSSMKIMLRYCTLMENGGQSGE